MLLSDTYNKKVLPELKKEFGYKNSLAIPKIKKIVINSSFGSTVTKKDANERKRFQERVVKVLSIITGQKPVLAQSRKSISSFGLKKGMTIGAKVTLRRKKMEDFLEKLLWITLPRTRDFRGISPKAVDKEGNLTVSFKDYTPFPEAPLDKQKGVFGLEATIVTTANNREEGLELLRLLGVPFKK